MKKRTSSKTDKTNSKNDGNNAFAKEKQQEIQRLAKLKLEQLQKSAMDNIAKITSTDQGQRRVEKKP